VPITTATHQIVVLPVEYVVTYKSQSDPKWLLDVRLYGAGKGMLAATLCPIVCYFGGILVWQA
jgi:hypothetical protein